MSDHIASTIADAYEEATRNALQLWHPECPFDPSTGFTIFPGGAVPVSWLREQITKLRTSAAERIETEAARAKYYRDMLNRKAGAK